VHHVLKSADHTYVLENAAWRCGRGEDLVNDERLKAAYVGL
jgi:hypothetical protein